MDERTALKAATCLTDLYKVTAKAVDLVFKTSDAALSRPGSSRSGGWLGVRRGGMSAGSFQSRTNRPEWRLMCMGTLSVFEDRLVFAGSTATEVVPFTSVVATRRSVAVNQWGKPIPMGVRLEVHREAGAPVAFSVLPSVADNIQFLLSVYGNDGGATDTHAREIASAQAEVEAARAEVEQATSDSVRAWNDLRDLLADPSATESSVTGAVARGRSLRATASPDVQAAIDDFIAHAEAKLSSLPQSSPPMEIRQLLSISKGEGPVRSWEQVIGQPRVCNRLRVHADAALARSAPMPHTLLAGSAGHGKVTLLRLLADHVGATVGVLAPAQTPNEVEIGFAEVEWANAVLIEDIDLLAENLATASRLAELIEAEQRRTVLATTTRLRSLPTSLQSAFPLTLVMHDYSWNDMKPIVSQLAAHLDIGLLGSTVSALADAAAGTPRKAQELVTLARDLQEVSGEYASAAEVLSLWET